MDASEWSARMDKRACGPPIVASMLLQQNFSKDILSATDWNREILRNTIILLILFLYIHHQEKNTRIY